MVMWRSGKAAEFIVDAAYGSTKRASGRVGHGRSERHKEFLLDGSDRRALCRRCVGTCFVTCNGHIEISQSVQIVLDPVFDVESDGGIHFL